MKKKYNGRLWVQIAFAALTNGYWRGFWEGKIYTGPGKQFCLPGLNCYSCPGALGACPIGALQAVMGSGQYIISFYVLGFLMVVGALCGRLVCGFLCPFGLVQDLLHKIPLPRGWKLRRIPGERRLSLLRYGVLLVFVLLLPNLVVNAAGQGDPWFCKWICPSGTLMGGIPLVSADAATQQTVGPLSWSVSLRDAIGGLFAWKVTLMALLLLWSVCYYRPFCRFLCPLGALYGLANPVSLYRYRIDEEKCTGCGLCARVCKLGIDPRKTPNSPQCIRCGECVRRCPEQAILPAKLFQRRRGGCAGCTGACRREKA